MQAFSKDQMNGLTIDQVVALLTSQTTKILDLSTTQLQILLKVMLGKVISTYKLDGQQASSAAPVVNHNPSAVPPNAYASKNPPG